MRKLLLSLCLFGNLAAYEHEIVFTPQEISNMVFKEYLHTHEQIEYFEKTYKEYDLQFLWGYQCACFQIYLKINGWDILDP